MQGFQVPDWKNSIMCAILGCCIVFFYKNPSGIDPSGQGKFN